MSGPRAAHEGTLAVVRLGAPCIQVKALPTCPAASAGSAMLFAGDAQPAAAKFARAAQHFSQV